jgi:hypothetical protein
MKRIFAFLFFVFLSLSPSFEIFAIERKGETFATEREGDIAVLNFIRGKDVPESVNTDFLRRIVMEEAARLTSYRVMTQENVFAILRDKGIDPNKCGDVECAVEYGRVLQADKVVVGYIEFIEGVYYLSLLLYDASSASVEKSVSRECENCPFKGLIEKTKDACKELFGAVEVPKVEPVKEGEVRVYVYDEKGNKITGDVYIDGVLAGKSHKSFSLSPGSHLIVVKKEGYKEEKKKVDVKAGETEDCEFRLKLEEKGKKRTPGSYFYLTGGIYGPLGGISEVSGPAPSIEAGASLFSLDGFSLSSGIRYTGNFERESPQFLLFYLEPSYFFLKKRNFLLGAYSDLWLGGGWMNYEKTYGEIGVNDRMFGGDIGLKMKIYYFAMKAGISLFNFGGTFTPALIIVLGVDIW